MSNYFTPGVYIEQAPNTLGINPVLGNTNLVGAFMGVAERGVVGVPYEIKSWGEYLEIFAADRPTPFIATSELAYAVYGFFQNGGTRCYVMRVAHTGDGTPINNAKSASVTVASGPTITAIGEGTWGNSLDIRIAVNADVAANFNLYVTLNDVLVESYFNVSNTASASNYWLSAINLSQYITGTGSLIKTDTGTAPDITTVYVALTGGTDGVTTVVDADYTGFMSNFDPIVDINLISVPGETSDALVAGLLTYCGGRSFLYAVIDCDYVETAISAVTMVKTLHGSGSFLFPWLKVVEPISSSTQVLHDCPPCGHVQGIMSRISRTRGVWKTPAGTETVIQGAVDTVVKLTQADTDALNIAGVTCIVPKTGYGIAVWGAKSIGGEYTAHVLLDQYIKKAIYEGTQPFVFEQNCANTRMRLATFVESFLSTVWKNGGLIGDSAADAYYVKCDDTNNTATTIRQGHLNCEVGYKRYGVAEFVVFKFSHEISQ